MQKEEEKKFKEVGEAFTVLSDPKKKARYDSGQDLEEEGVNMGGEALGRTWRQRAWIGRADWSGPGGGGGCEQGVRPAPILIRGQPVEVVPSFKYLGVHLDSKLDWVSWLGSPCTNYTWDGPEWVEKQAIKALLLHLFLGCSACS